MNREPHLSRRTLLQSLATLALPLTALTGCGRTKPNSLIVGGLPVTCNLTLPVACVGKGTANQALPAGAARFEY
jgi:NitT/TauT family transport system substrate-binding protein